MSKRSIKFVGIVLLTAGLTAFDFNNPAFNGNYKALALGIAGLAVTAIGIWLDRNKT